MKIWLPYFTTGGGGDVYTDRLAAALERLGHQVVVQPFAHKWQHFPHAVSRAAPPAGTDLAIADIVTGFAFRRRGMKLLAVSHHCVLDPGYAPYRSFAQTVYHEGLLRFYERWSLEAADAIVAVSRHTARSLGRVYGVKDVQVVLNGLDTEFFTPGPAKEPLHDRKFRVLFVGNHIRRKGFDLLDPIMQRLGEGFVLQATAGLRGYANIGTNIEILGRLDTEGLRDAYRRADVLLFPSRFEGFGYVVAEAMACGTPTVCSDASSLPELLEDEVSGLLCPVDDVEAFATAIRSLAASADRRAAMGEAARRYVVERFSLPAWDARLKGVLEKIIEKP